MTQYIPGVTPMPPSPGTPNTSGRKTVDVPLTGDRRFVGGLYPFSWTLDTYGRQHNPDLIGFDVLDLLRREPSVAGGLTLIKAPILGSLRQAQITCEDPAIRAALTEVFIDSGLLYRLGRTALRALDFGVAFHEIEWEPRPLSATYEEPVPGLPQAPQPTIPPSGPVPTPAAPPPPSPVPSPAAPPTPPNPPKKISIPAFRGPGIWPKALDEVNPRTVAAILRRVGAKGQGQRGGKPADGSYDGFVQRQATGEVPVEAVNSFVYSNDLEYGNLWGRARTRYAYPAYFWKQTVMKLWMLWVEKQTKADRIGRYPSGVTEGRDNQDWMLDLVNSLDTSATVLMPSDLIGTPDPNRSTNLYAWLIEELKTTDKVDVFERTVQRLDGEMLKAMFAMERTFTPAKDTGTYSEVQAQGEIFMQTEEALQEDLREAIVGYLIHRTQDLNWGPDSPRAGLSFPGLTENQRTFLAQLILNISRARDNTPLTNIIDMRELAEQFAIPASDLTAEESAAVAGSPGVQQIVPGTAPEGGTGTEPGAAGDVSQILPTAQQFGGSGSGGVR